MIEKQKQQNNNNNKSIRINYVYYIIIDEKRIGMPRPKRMEKSREEMT